MDHDPSSERFGQMTGLSAQQTLRREKVQLIRQRGQISPGGRSAPTIPIAPHFMVGSRNPRPAQAARICDYISNNIEICVISTP